MVSINLIKPNLLLFFIFKIYPTFGDITSITWDFSNPDAIGVNMYGIAKKNGAWHGVKLNVDK